MRSRIDTAQGSFTRFPPSWLLVVEIWNQAASGLFFKVCRGFAVVSKSNDYQTLTQRYRTRRQCHSPSLSSFHPPPPLKISSFINFCRTYFQTFYVIQIQKISLCHHKRFCRESFGKNVMTNGQTNRQTDRQTDRQTNKRDRKHYLSDFIGRGN